MANENDDSPMTANLGLVSGMGTSSPFGFATPPPPPFVRHPGDVSMDAVQRTQTMAMNTMQTAAMNRPGAMGGFSQQYGANMNAMNAQMFNPFVAQTMASMSGMGGFTPGMMPSPVSMTSPSMGVYRPSFAGHAGMFPPTPPMPLMAPYNPFAASMPSPSFSTPMDFGYDQARYRGMQQAGAFVAAPGVIARGAADIYSSGIGGGIGALIGSKFGARGAALGSSIGTLAGLVGGEALGFGAAAERITDRFNPFRTIYNQGSQLQTGSTGYVVGGSDLEVTGRGLNGNASRHLATQLRQFSRSMPSSGDSFTNTDMIKMTQLAGENGLLNMSQGTDQIVAQMKTVAKSMKVFMQLAGEPDMRAAMKSMGQLYSMGLSIPEAVGTAQNARMYARMAGTSFKGIMQAGLAGAEIFQAHGLTAGLGLNVGMGSMGIAQQAVSAGAYSPQLLAMQGGVQGIAQREMMSQAATLRMPMMAAAVANFSGGAGGGFSMNSGTAAGMASGQYNMHQLTTMGANNLLNAVNNGGGVGALGMYRLQQPMLQDQLGRQLGPMGMQNMGFQNVLQNMKMLGLSGAGGFATVASRFYGDAKATDMVAQASSPEFMANMQKQLTVQRNDLRGQAHKAFEANRPGFIEKHTGIKPLSEQGWYNSMSEGFYEGVENIGAAFDFTNENAAEANGQSLQRVSSRLLASSPNERRNMARVSNKDVAREFALLKKSARGGVYADSDAIGYNARGEAYGSNLGITDGAISDEYRAAKGGGLTGLFDSIFSDYDKKDKTMQQVGRASRALSKGLNADVSDMKKTSSKLSAAGIDASFIDDFTGAMLNSTSDKSITREHITIAQELGKRRGINVTEEMAEELLTSQAGVLKAVGGKEKANAYTPRAAGANRGLNNLMATASERQSSLLKTVSGGADEKVSQKMMDILYSAGNSDAAAFAALTLADHSKGEAFLATLPEEKRAATKKAGISIIEALKSDSRLVDAAKEYARSLNNMTAGTKGTLSQSAAGIGKKFAAGKEVVSLAMGLEKMGLGNLSREVGVDDMGALLNKIADDPGATSDENMKKLASRYRAAAGKTEEQAAIADEATSLGRNRGGDTSNVNMTGGIMGNEKMLDQISSDLGITSSQLGEIFKNGSPLERSAVQLDYAANKLVEAAGKLGAP